MYIEAHAAVRIHIKCFLHTYYTVYLRTAIVFLFFEEVNLLTSSYIATMSPYIIIVHCSMFNMIMVLCHSCIIMIHNFIHLF